MLAEEEDTVRGVSKAEKRDWMEEQGAGALGPGGEEELPLFLPTPDLVASAGEWE